jgi:hypothetical protein
MGAKVTYLETLRNVA